MYGRYYGGRMYEEDAISYSGFDWLVFPFLQCRAIKQDDQYYQCGLCICAVGDSFDGVVFSYNGIDYIYPENRRMRALMEILRVLKKGGLFIYSSHNRSGIFSSLHMIHNFIINLITLQISSKYWYDVHKGGILTTYFTNKTQEIQILQGIGFRIIEVKDSRGKCPPWTYYVFEKQ